MNLKNGIFIAIAITLCGALTQRAVAEHKKPNFVITFTDDQGYGDLGCYGSEDVKTPRIDQMAAEGAKLTSFYMAAPTAPLPAQP